MGLSSEKYVTGTLGGVVKWYHVNQLIIEREKVSVLHARHPLLIREAEGERHHEKYCKNIFGPINPDLRQCINFTKK